MQTSSSVESSLEPLSKTHFSEPTIYFESQKSQLHSEQSDITIWELIKANWIVITIFALLLGVTILCVLIPVRSHTTQLSILRCTIDFVFRERCCKCPHVACKRYASASQACDGKKTRRSLERAVQEAGSSNAYVSCSSCPSRYRSGQVSCG